MLTLVDKDPDQAEGCCGRGSVRFEPFRPSPLGVAGVVLSSGLAPSEAASLEGSLQGFRTHRFPGLWVNVGSPQLVTALEALVLGLGP